MEVVLYLDELNLISNPEIVTMKLPYQFRERWRSVACDQQDRHGQRPKFIDLIQFIKKQDSETQSTQKDNKIQDNHQA